MPRGFSECAGVLVGTFYDVHQFGTAAEVNVYCRLDKRYRIDTVTKKKTLAGQKYVYKYVF